MGQYGPVHGGVEYKFNGASGAANMAVEADIGAEYLGASIDMVYLHIRDAVGAGILSAAQVADLHTATTERHSAGIAATV